MSEKIELKPCPFCGSETVSFMEDEEQHDEINSTTGFIWCFECNFSSDSFYSKSIAAEKWNTRTPDIVRCGECVFEEDCHKWITFCKRDYVLEQNVYEHKRLDFCSYGQRKETKK